MSRSPVLLDFSSEWMKSHTFKHIFLLEETDEGLETRLVGQLRLLKKSGKMPRFQFHPAPEFLGSWGIAEKRFFPDFHSDEPEDALENIRKELYKACADGGGKFPAETSRILGLRQPILRPMFGDRFIFRADELSRDGIAQVDYIAEAGESLIRAGELSRHEDEDGVYHNLRFCSHLAWLLQIKPGGDFAAPGEPPEFFEQLAEACNWRWFDLKAKFPAPHGYYSPLNFWPYIV